MSEGTEKTPCPDVTAVNVSAVPLFLTTTSAPGTTPPPASTITPETDAVEDPCAAAVSGSTIRRIRIAMATYRFFISAHRTQAPIDRQGKVVPNAPGMGSDDRDRPKVRARGGFIDRRAPGGRRNSSARQSGPAMSVCRRGPASDRDGG